ncbi:DUF1295 domain-containing protein [Chloroflexota bacterium]
MLYIIFGAIGFTLCHLFDLVSLKRVPGLKPVVWVIGCGLLVYSLVMIYLTPGELLFPKWLIGLGWGILGLSATLLIYSLFINLPFRKTYVKRGVGDRLVTTGMYSLTRHPGVIWFSLLMLSLIPIAQNRLMLVAAPVFIALDIILVVIQDRVIMRCMFAGYDGYRLKTPMLLPNRRSMSVFLRSLRQVKY